MKLARFSQFVIVLALIGLGIFAFNVWKERAEADYEASLRTAWEQGGVQKVAQRSSQIYEFGDRVKRDELASLRDAVITERDPSAPTICDPAYEEDAKFSASLKKIEIPKEPREDEYVKISIELENTGDAPWYGEDYPCDVNPRLRLANPENLEAEHQLWNDLNFPDDGWLHNEYKNRIGLNDKVVAPGKVAEFSFWVEAPKLTETHVVSTEIDEETGEEVEEKKEYRWAYDKYTFAPVLGENVLGPEIPVVLSSGEMPPSEREKIDYIALSNKNFSLKDYQGERNIFVNLANQTAYIRFGEEEVLASQVSTGAWDTPTPLGDYTIYNKQELRVGGTAPHYRMPHWMGLRDSGGSFRGYGLHGLPYLGSKEGGWFWEEAVDHLGTPVSHGCVRFDPEKIPMVYDFVEVGTPVYVRRVEKEVAEPQLVAA